MVNSNAGQIESITSAGARGSLCSDFIIHAKVPFSPWDTLTTTVNATIQGGAIVDVFNLAFPNLSNITTVDHR